MKYSWETSSLGTRQQRLLHLQRIKLLDPAAVEDARQLDEEIDALVASIGREAKNLDMPGYIANESAILLAATPADLPIERQKELVRRVTAFADELMPAASGRVWGAAVGIIGSFMASNVSLLLLAVPGLGKGKIAQLTTRAFLRLAPKSFVAATRLAGPVGEMTRKMSSRIPAIAQEVVKAGTPSANNIAFWSLMGAMEDAGEEWSHLLDVWRRRVEPPTAFLARQEDFSKSLAEFTREFTSSRVFDNGEGDFKKYILSRELRPYRLTLEDLIYDFYWLECACNWLKKSNRGADNQHFVEMRKSMAVLIHQLVANGIDELSVSPAYPLFGWWSGVPADVFDALNQLAIMSESTREAFQQMGFTDSETFQSIAVTLMQSATKAGLTAIEQGLAGRGFGGFLAKAASSAIVKKASPALLRLEDLRN